VSFILRDYQKSLVAGLHRETRLGEVGLRLLVVIATGGGKTGVLNEFLKSVVAQGKRALIVTKDWMLLSQAEKDFTTRCHGAGLTGYLGSGQEARRLFKDTPRTVNQPVVYTTIHSWVSRADDTFKDVHFDYVFIDELHWGEAGALYSKLMARYKDTSTFIGFTATPRHWTQFKLVDRAYDFAELLNRQVLSRPVVVDPRSTEVVWTPVLSSEHGDITQTSLNELAANEARNRLIVKTYCDETAKWGKTLIFACNIDHAEVLCGMFQTRGVRAAVIHHKVQVAEKQVIREMFKNGDLDVLVNVTMYTHGVDIPEIKSVFMARPTTSDILYSQMIGRGSRRTDTKDFFYVVDFVDVVQKHGIPIIRPDGFFGAVALTSRSRNPAIKKHVYKKAPFTSFPAIPGYEALEGLDIQPEQTFGIEFEITPKGAEKDGDIRLGSGELHRVSVEVAAALNGVAPFLISYSSDYSAWQLKPDASCGLELVSRILKGPEGFMEVYDVLRLLHPLFDRLGYTVSKRTGMHDHFGADGVHFNTLKRFLSFVAYYEPALYSVIAPSRVNNQFTQSVRKFYRKLRLQPSQEWKNASSHYDGVSMHPLWHRRQTFEVRMHNGSLDAVKALTWVSLWMRIFAKAQKTAAYAGDASKRLSRSPLSPGPRGDIAHLADFVGASENLKRRLIERRRQVIRQSWIKHEKWGKLSKQLFRKWYPGELPPDPMMAFVTPPQIVIPKMTATLMGP
jgi:superfamily II DNA or RNA helicase